MTITVNGRYCRRFFLIPEGPAFKPRLTPDESWVNPRQMYWSLRDITDHFRELSKVHDKLQFTVLGVQYRSEISQIHSVGDVEKFVVGKIIKGPRGGAVFIRKGGS